MRTVFKSGNYIEAQIVLGMMHSYGLAAEFSGDYLVGGVGGLPAADLYILRVPETDYAKASEVMTDYLNGDLESSE